MVEREEREFEAADYRSSAARPATLRVSWPTGSRAKAVRLVVFCAAWFGFLAFWYLRAFRTGTPTVTLLFPVLHVAGGLVLFHRALVTFLNTTRLTVASGLLEVRSGPVPVPGNVRLGASRVRQLFVRRRDARSRRGGTTTTFTVEAILDTGSQLVLARGFEEANAARYVCEVLGSALGVVPQPPVEVVL